MPKYQVEQFELHSQVYDIEADSEAEAIALLLSGGAEEFADCLVYIQVCKDLGLPIDKYKELAKQLQSRGIVMGDKIIPSIASIVEI